MSLNGQVGQTSGAAKTSEQGVLVLGHSFVKGLDKWLRQNRDVSSVVCGHQVYFGGVSGQRVPALEATLEGMVAKREYVCVVLEIGSNDLCAAVSGADVVAGSIYQLAKRLRETCNIQHVVVFEVLRREEGCRHSRWMEVSLEEYNERVELVNANLKVWCSGESGITFRTHHARAKRLDDDGVHVRPMWMKNYWRSVEGAIMSEVGAAV